MLKTRSGPLARPVSYFRENPIVISKIIDFKVRDLEKNIDSTSLFFLNDESKCSIY